MTLINVQPAQLVNLYIEIITIETNNGSYIAGRYFKIFYSGHQL